MFRLFFILWVLLFGMASFELMANGGSDACPSSTLMWEQGKVLAMGEGNTRSKAYEAARQDLSTQVGEAIVEAQFIKRADGVNSEFESYASVFSETRLQAHKIEDETLICNSGGFITYLLFDKRSLANKIASVIGKQLTVYEQTQQQKTRLLGPAFLTNSPLFAPYRDAGAAHTTHLHITYYNAQYTLSINHDRIAISEQEFLQLLKVPSEQNNLLALSSVTLNHERPIDITILANSPTQAAYQVYVCSPANDCFMLHHGAHHGTLLTLKTPWTSASPKTLILLLVPTGHDAFTGAVGEPSVEQNLLSLLSLAYQKPLIGMHIIYHQ